MDKNWNKHKLFGNNAEKIVEFLINSMPNWKCCQFGVETHIKDIKDMVSGSENPISLKIRKMPDFVVFNEKTGETFFVEVKYSSNSEREGYLFKYLENYNEYWNGTKLIIVRQNKPYFVWVSLEKVNNTMRKMKQVMGEWKVSWDFGDIEQDIKTLFPDLTDEVIEQAIKMLPQK